MDDVYIGASQDEGWLVPAQRTSGRKLKKPLSLLPLETETRRSEVLLAFHRTRLLSFSIFIMRFLLLFQLKAVSF